MLIECNTLQIGINLQRQTRPQPLVRHLNAVQPFNLHAGLDKLASDHQEAMLYGDAAPYSTDVPCTSACLDLYATMTV